MRVEIWSDVVCPWCYIGKRRFERALGEFEHADEVEVVWRSFELDPDAPPRRGSSAEHLMRKYGWTAEQVAASNERLRGLAGAERLDYRLEETQGGNTFDAHRLIHAAAAAGRGDEMKERLLRAYFTDGVAVGDREELVAVASPVVPDAAEVLASDRYAEDVRADEHEARVLGIHGVPFFVFDRRYAVEGAQASEVILGALRQAWSERAAA